MDESEWRNAVRAETASSRRPGEGAKVEPDAVKMFNALIAMEPNTTISYLVLAEAVGPELKPRSRRFWTVLRAARALAKDPAVNVEFPSERGVGVRRLPENGRSAQCARKFVNVARQTGRIAQSAAMIRTELLTESERNTATHVRRLTAAAADALRATRTEIGRALTGGVQALPRGK
jgi:hypothetical protein